MEICCIDVYRNEASFWEGYSHFTRGREYKCPYTEGDDRTRWAIGFSHAVAQYNAGKPWYKSRTLWGCVACVAVGVGLIVFSNYLSQSNGGMMMGAGSGLTLGGVLNVFLRLVTREPVYFNRGYGGGLDSVMGR